MRKTTIKTRRKSTKPNWKLQIDWGGEKLTPPLTRHFVSKSVREALTVALKSPGTSKVHVGIAFVSAAKMKRLNQQYRKKNRPTDVLSFEVQEVKSAHLRFLGDLVLCLSVAKKNAKALEMPVKEQVRHLIVHGVLHLLGHDHEQGPRKAAKMFRLQNRILKSEWKY